MSIHNANAISEAFPPSDASVQTQWKRCLEAIKNEVSLQTLQTWFLPIIPVSFVDDTLILRVPSRFFFEWIDTHYGHLLESTVRKVFGLRTRLEFLIAPSHRDKEPLDEVEEEPEERGPVQPDGFSSEDCELDTHCRLSNFFVNNDNELALKSAEYVANHTTRVKFNPLVIYGEVGTGKSHLLHAIGNHVQERRPRSRILYINAEKFLNEYVYALQHADINNFKKKLTSADLFLMDDIQILSNKPKSQEGLLYILMELEKKRRQIVLTVNVPPANLINFNPRLISFFQKGLIVDLIHPSVESRRKVIDFQLEQNGLKLAPEIVDFLVENLTTDMHLLNAAMIRIIAQISLIGKPLDLDQAKFIVAQIYPQWQGLNGLGMRKKRIDIELIQQVVADYFNLPVDVLIGSSRKREIQLARQIAIYLAREITGESLIRIGYQFGNRNHTTVLHSHKKIQKEIGHNPILKSTVLQLKSQILDA